MLSQKLSMVGVHMYEGCKATCDTKVETKPMGGGSTGFGKETTQIHHTYRN